MFRFALLCDVFVCLCVVCARLCVSVCLFVCLFVCVRALVCLVVCLFVCVFVCVLFVVWCLLSVVDLAVVVVVCGCPLFGLV